MSEPGSAGKLNGRPLRKQHNRGAWQMLQSLVDRVQGSEFTGLS